MTIWVNKQKDGCGIIQACIATTDQKMAEDCHHNWHNKLTEKQKRQGWTAVLSTVNSWEEVPVNALKLN